MATILLHDAQNAIRLLRMRPGFSWSVILTVATASGFLGVAANLVTALLAPYVVNRPIDTWLDHAPVRALVPVAGVLLMAGAMVLVAATTNLATLTMGHYLGRLGEFAVRASLGATPRQLARQLVTEGLVLACLACALGGVVSFWTRQLLFSWLSPEQASIVEAGTSAGTTAAAMAVSLVACAMAVFGCARVATGVGMPLLHAATGNLAAAARGARPRRRLIVVQVATACLLLVVATLLRSGMNQALQTGPGTTAAQVAVIHTIAATRYEDPARGRRFQLAAIERTSRLPGISSVALTATLPLVSASRMGYADNPHGPFRPYDAITVSSGYFKTMQHPLSWGHEFSPRDDVVAGRVVINEQFANAMFGGGKVGPYVYAEDGSHMEVIGVATDARYRQMERPVAATVYLPLSSRFLSGFHLVARATGDAPPIAAIVDTLRSIDSVAIDRETTLDGHLQAAVRRDRIAMVFVAACGLLILLFAASGPYQLARHAVTSRYDELAVRLAIGARGRHIFGLVLAQTTQATIAGVLIGEAAAMTLAAVFAGLTGVSAGSAAGIALAIGAILTMLCAAAAAVPALGVYRLSPAAALR